MPGIVKFELINKDIIAQVKAFQESVDNMPDSYSLGLDTKVIMVEEYAVLLIDYAFEKLRVELNKND